MMQLFKMAFRDLGRNRRRSFFSALAVSVGLAILMLMASVVNGEMGSAIQGAIHPCRPAIFRSGRPAMTKTSPA